MIVTCPACATRTNFQNALRAPGSVKITCRACGHKWIEIEDDEIIDVDLFRRPLDSMPRPAVQDAEEVDQDVQRLVEAARAADDSLLEQRQQRRKSFYRWGAYAASVAACLSVFALFPEFFVRTAPASVRAYSALGIDVNLYGLEIRRVKQQHAIVKGVRVLTITGDVVNVTDDTQKIPWLRFGLRDVKSAEVYQWTLNTESRPLRAGEITSFVTRVAAPPESASDVQIRFAHEQETQS